MYSNKYITVYTVIMTLIVSVILAFLVTGLKPYHDSSEAVFKKKDIMGAIADQIPSDLKSMPDDQILKLFTDKFEQVVLDANGQQVDGAMAEKVDMAAEEKKPEAERKYPVFVYNGDKGKVYLLSVRGNGLWDKIWGYIALGEDLNTVVGVSFGHVSETPGLGAEIKDNPNFPAQFKGKKIFQDGQYVSVAVVKGGAKNPDHEVDAISGATITSVGVSDMLQKGLKAYLPYIESLKTAN
ncbi:MAG: NADH:ubiquinone reductase (Na(+)-transporting) subunit C [Haliscomenobacter sp.]|nr:NADH:ubiquinone reductase (Na(+)-transporting) subunit C [Haliscomenobacter sp.]MBK8653891.1 NADH:ubiquinone reductase (Na(+)-transporting) subunit C [Haliscomenobacter sp.]MBP9076541.1 NADH:ubiquinone reductase (Na(+)-transporting) subunit C [Haliscomenobacter sp.]MBP9874204.1 NADH:ubiquinone reductase (Na(+)-transporting) subunit C [Haliscomenobacter sp.]